MCTVMDHETFERRTRQRIADLYGDEQAGDVLEKLRSLVWRHQSLRHGSHTGPRWSERDTLLITYGDSVQRPGASSLRVLKDFIDRRLSDVFTLVHILPFFPFSSDDGFAVLDFRAVNSDLGDWEDIASLGENFSLVFDLILNHMSREHLWFVNYVNDIEPGKGYVVEVDPDENLSLVVRPRNTPLLSRVRKPRDITYVWATFSNDQIDLNFGNPDVLLAMTDILLEYLRRGARAIRLDAVGFLWKQIGTSCIHLPQTHQIIKLFRDLFDYLEPGAILLTETNVPHHENITYFGDGDETHMVYQFSLPPLVLHAIHTQSTKYLTRWAHGIDEEHLPPACTYLNFTASHDGIGLRPLEGIVPDEEVNNLLDAMRNRGGYVSTRTMPEGFDRPYELNISYYDAFRDPDDPNTDHLVARFLLSQTLPLALRGIPAVYINALVATPNDQLGVERTGKTRSVNRRKWDGAELERLVDNPNCEAGKVFPEYVRRLGLRRSFAAFHPEAKQRVLHLEDGLFGVERVSIDNTQVLVALHNCTDRTRSVEHDVLLGRQWRDVLNLTALAVDRGCVVLPSFAVAWLVAT